MSHSVWAKWSHSGVQCPETDCSEVEDIFGTICVFKPFLQDVIMHCWYCFSKYSMFRTTCQASVPVLFYFLVLLRIIHLSSTVQLIWHCPLPFCEDCVSCSTDNATAATQSRSRTIIQRPANGGQECPDTLYEERECDSVPICPVYR